MADSESKDTPGAGGGSAVRRAVIDVGTNSVKLLVADVQGGEVVPVTEESRQTRLGEGFYREHLLQPEAILRTAQAVKIFADKATALGAAGIRVYGTSAVREAGNAGQLAQAIKTATQLNLEIISAETEADWAFRGVVSHPGFAGESFLLVDLGGGSAQFILGHNGHAVYSGSFPLGCVRWLEKSALSDPPTAQEKQHCLERLGGFVKAAVAPALQPYLAASGADNYQWVGIGGTATILARMETAMTGFDRERIESLRITAERLRQWRDQLWAMPLVRRRAIVGLPANRADVILIGTAIYTVLMEAFRVKELRISTRGPRFGALLAGDQQAR